jgi:hypothetical protein
LRIKKEKEINKLLSWKLTVSQQEDLKDDNIWQITDATKFKTRLITNFESGTRTFEGK